MGVVPRVPADLSYYALAALALDAPSQPPQHQNANG
jgi:hypothetical protein